VIGTTLGPYRIDAELGAGGMGRVWRATVVRATAGLSKGSVVALKVVHPHLMDSPDFFKRFVREAELGRTVVHENVVRTYDAVALRGRHALVMEHVEGQTLRSLLEELDRVPEELCRHIGREIARGLAAIHAVGIVHRDLKPENVIISRCAAPEHDHAVERRGSKTGGSEARVHHRCDHVVKIMDLGVARLVDEAARLSQTGAFVGSVHYAAPEQFGADGVDHRADLHALGLVLYELAGGAHPWLDDDYRVVLKKATHDAPRRISEINPQVSPFFEELVHKLLAKRPDERFASANEVVRILEAGEGGTWWRGREKALRMQTRRPLRRVRVPRETTLVGRDEELARLRAFYERAKSGAGQVVLVEGEAGIGKSRLVDEFVGSLTDGGEDLNYLAGSYPPAGAATASGAFAAAYREHFGAEGLDETLRTHLEQSPVLAPAFAALLRGETTPAGAEPLTKDTLQTCFVHATRSLAASRPTIVLIDDLHFAPEEGRALFVSLALAVPGHRILLVGTTRPGDESRWAAEVERTGVLARLTLSRLGAKDVGRLLVNALRSERLADELGFQIVVKSDGNPFFVFEILRGLKEGRLLAQRPDGTWISTQAIREIKAPSTIEELVQARIADLDEDQRTLLEIAACLGFEFDAALVGDVAGLGLIPLLRTLGTIEKTHRLIRASGRLFAFDHHQLQESLYAGLSEFHRVAYHAAIARAIEARAGGTTADPKSLDGALCVDLAAHFLKGFACAGYGAERTGTVPDAGTGAGLAGGESGSALGAKAARYLDQALTHLEKAYRNGEALELIDRALAASGVAVGATRASLLLRKAQRLDLLGRREPQREALDEALSLADADGDAALRARVRVSLAVLHSSVWRHEDAVARLLEALELARAAGAVVVESDAARNLGNAFDNVGRVDEARAQYERSLALAREGGEVDREASATINLGNVFLLLGRLAQAKEQFERGLVLARRCGNRRWEDVATGNLGIVAVSLGRYAEARERFERSLETAREIGDRQGEARATAGLGVVLFSLGRFAESWEFGERRLALVRETADRRGESLGLENLGALNRHVGRFAEARRLFEGALGIAREIGARHNEAHVLQTIADLDWEEGDVDASARATSEAIEIRRAVGGRDGEAESLCMRGTLAARLGRVDDARADLEAALAIARELSMPAVELKAVAELAGLPGGDVAAALATLAERADRIDVVTAMEVRFALWKATGDRAHLAEAKRLLDFLAEHAPPDSRGTMLSEVRLHREIVAAAKDAGL
jgi:tetratricopeptide (TPR) repeat protein